MKINLFSKLKLKRGFYLNRAVRLLWKSVPGWIVANLVLVILQGVLPLVTLYLTKLVVDAVTAGIAAPDKGAVFSRVALLIGLMGGAALLSILFTLLSGLVSEAQSQVISDQVYDDLHAKSIEVDLEYYENTQYYDTLSRAQNEAPHRPSHIVNGLVTLVRSGISLVAIVALLFVFHWAIALILFVTAIPGVLVRLRYSGKIYRWQRERTSTERQSWYLHWVLTGEMFAKEIRLFNLGSLFMDRFQVLRKKLRREKLAISTKRSFSEFAAQTIPILAIFGSFAFVSNKALQGTITLGSLVMFYQAFQRGRGYLQQLLGSMADLYEDNLFLSYLYEFLDLKPKVLEPSHPRPIPKPMQKGIVFDRVGFQYPTGSSKVFEEISLTIRPGQVVALVGENGSGKTTLVKLLSRLYDPIEGSITLDGVDLRDFNTKDLRREISVIFQDYVRYHLSARENIWFGNIELPPDLKHVIAAARNSGADEIISRLPHGYDTTLGKWFEDGEELSLGEWQKVALARAFIRESQIIVLDEPTSALDAQAEYDVFKRFRQLTEGRSAILISHRFSTIRMADFIYVLNSGRIVEKGTHEELVKRAGMYARLYERQAQSYR